MLQLLDGLAVEVDALSAGGAAQVAETYSIWGKGSRINFGDCFSYFTARAHGARLLYVGNDFSKTDVTDAL